MSAHHSHLNESDIALTHAPTPPSYWSLDIDRTDPHANTRPTLIVLHALCLALAFLAALPLAIAMRSASHRARPYIIIAFYVLLTLGCLSGILYTNAYTDMYEHNVHRPHGYLLIFSAIILNLVDFLPIIRRILASVLHIQSPFWSSVILGSPSDASAPEYIGLISQEPEEIDQDGQHGSPIKHLPGSLLSTETDQRDTLQWANDVRRHHHHVRVHDCSHSITSDRTLFGSSRSSSADAANDASDFPTQPLLVRIGRFVFLALERALVLAAYGISITGIVVYTGGCRENYMNGCMAHLIKGSIFWCYGLFTFARFLGTFSDLGWAWNNAPLSRYPTAEFVESLLIFLYGATNTWMERFGANSGDPFTAKQIQHISIAVMFCFAGLAGMAIESRRIRKWLAFPAVLSLRRRGFPQRFEDPPSYNASFNPLPALVIGVTGVAMAAHHQNYAFQVQIHALWGNLLSAFSVLRFLTYFLLWLSPPKSPLPSRPPTEILASVFLACGGLVFMFSTEEVTFAAMRRNRDDVMMFLNVSVALTCLAFCWVMTVVTFKAWITSHSQQQFTFQNLQSVTQNVA